jgi:hypothetical protein
VFKLRIFCRYKGFRAEFTGRSVADCENKADAAGWYEGGSIVFLR